MSATPGPWTVHKSRGMNSYELRAGEAYLADIWGADHPVTNGVARGAVKYNARLIASAPYLLETLKALLAEIEDYQRINHLGGENNQTQLNARAAIKKAEGQ